MHNMDDFSFVANSDISSIDELYRKYTEDPESVDSSFASFFKGYDFAMKNFQPLPGKVISKEFNVINLIHGYRQRGHFFTKTNPVRNRRQYSPTLAIENFGLENTDLETVFEAGTQIGIGPAKLKDIIEHLEATYCRSIGVEYLYIRRPEVIEWMKQKMESTRNEPVFDNNQKKNFFHQLKRAVNFEDFIHKKFVGQKRFSLEGGEALITGLYSIIRKGASFGAEEFIIGMAHRGRLNVLTNILEKPYRNVFKEFVAQDYDESVTLGDVKYHLGFNKKVTLEDGKEVNLALLPNPSHLETVTPIAIGLARSRIDHAYNHDYDKVVPIVIHGDAAIATQGIMYEVVQMGTLDGYKSGGTIHVVVNNQVGFTTNYIEARSSTYCTDIAKVTRNPVFHVNGDDTEAVAYVFELAMEYRQKFNTDVFIDILCYRKYGHNEGDEPRFTQPLLYKTIAKHPNPLQVYAAQLQKENVLSEKEAQSYIAEYNEHLEEELTASKEIDKVSIPRFMPDLWSKFPFADDDDFKHPIETNVSQQTIDRLWTDMNQVPQDKLFFKKVHKILDDRQKMYDSGKLDWAMGELLAYASLINDDYPVRLSGQDTERGTFAHRHASFTQEDVRERYMPLRDSGKFKAPFTAYNSPLSEYGVLGFEYGFALGVPNGLTIWEAQFGDFHNVAQVIIDQYISSAEEKWGVLNGIVLYLPHGYEGQGPEHSSGRIERFLTMSARNNMQVMNFTTPANLFHALRMQMMRNIRLPMIVFTPKSLLRHPKCISSVSDLVEGGFQEVIDDTDVNVDSVTRLVFCSGKIYYELLERKEELKARNVALVRIEQLHPFPKEQVEAIIAKYSTALLTLWVQEEPENMGAWTYINRMMSDHHIVPIARLASASPATGLAKLHTLGQQEIINKVFKPCHCHKKLPYCNLDCVEGKSREEILKQHYYFTDNARFSI